MGERFVLPVAVASLLFLHVPGQAAAINVDTVATADTFVRQDGPATAYGTRGGLSVAGSSARNGAGNLVGLADTFLRFNLAFAVASLDAQFGSHSWTISDITLRLVEFAAPPNNDFGRGQGAFEVRWLVADNWSETSLTWDGRGGYVNPGADAAVGQFTNLFAGDQYTPIQRFNLSLSNVLVNDIRSGGDVSFLLTATSSAIGFTPNSRDVTGARPKPYLEITAVPEPATLGLWGLGTLAAVLRLRKGLLK